MSPQTAVLLEAFLGRSRDWRYGYDLSRETALKSGTLYPILMRLSRSRWLETRWAEPETVGRPPRHMYRLTLEGLRCAREKLKPKTARVSVRRAYAEGKE
jgi:DNA-binding PadR family transcriptional regulator